MISMFLSRITLSLLSIKVSHKPIFVRIMFRSVYETGSWFSFWEIYISFSALASALFHRGVSLRRGRLSSIIPDFSSTVGVCPGGFFIRRLYSTFVNRFYNFHTLKHINSIFKQNVFVIKALNIGLVKPDIRHDV